MRSVFKKMLFAVLPILIVITSMNVYFAGYQNCMQIIGEISEITVKPGDLILGVSMFPGGTERASEFMSRSAVDWAKTKKGFSYAYTFNNKSCGNHDYNCSQLVWCAYRQTSGVDLDSDGTWFVSPSDMKDSEFTFIIWSY